MLFPKTLTTIEDYAFSECTGLQSLRLPNGVTSVGTRAFALCNGLKRVYLPQSLVTLGHRAFYRCKALQTVYCEAEALPDGWSSSWLSDTDATVHWGYGTD